MELWNSIRNFFSGRRLQEPNFDQRIEEPKWEIDIDIHNPRSFNRNEHFHIFTDPLQITRYFESQMESMITNFFYGFKNEGFDGIIDFNALPFESPQKDNLRDEVLKSNGQMGLKLDSDLDGKVTKDNFSNIWNETDKPKLELSRPSIIGRSMRKEYVRKPDGTIEQKQIIRDSEGNEEITVKHQIGDKIHTIVTKRDKNGVETKIEDFVNTDECKCNGMEQPLLNEKIDFPKIDLNFFPWDKFFKPDPKL
ncbi:uncharacterized protein LOC143424573 [Xylocopa sonorina]|uniref:uncharacterized protein LOC143424573 n=1 Tax=Xylocopa sonorina TaxID=1818115 RepID=UPI00403A93BD